MILQQCDVFEGCLELLSKFRIGGNNLAEGLAISSLSSGKVGQGVGGCILLFFLIVDVVGESGASAGGLFLEVEFGLSV